MRHRHHPHSQETPTLCTALSRGFVFILRSFAPSARDVVAEVKHHRKATAALLLPSAALEPKVERMCRFKLRFKLHSPGGGQIESVALVVCAIQFVQFVIAVTSSEVSRFCEPSSSFARKALSSKSWPFLPKSCVVRVEISRFFSRRCGAASHLSVLSQHSAWRCAKKIPRCLPDSGGMSFAARTAGRVARSGFSTWRRWGAIA